MVATPRVAIPKPQRGTEAADEQVSVDIYNSILTKWDDYICAYQCTSDPSSPFFGLIIHRTDTNNLKLYTGAAWKTLDDPPSSSNVSIVKYYELAADVTVPTTTYAKVLYADSFTIETNTRYLIEAHACYFNTNVGVYGPNTFKTVYAAGAHTNLNVANNPIGTPSERYLSNITGASAGWGRATLIWLWETGALSGTYSVGVYGHAADNDQDLKLWGADAAYRSNLVVKKVGTY